MGEQLKQQQEQMLEQQRQHQKALLEERQKSRKADPGETESSTAAPPKKSKDKAKSSTDAPGVQLQLRDPSAPVAAVAYGEVSSAAVQNDFFGSVPDVKAEEESPKV